MLACDLIVEVRAARCISAEQTAEVERLMPIGEAISREMLDFLFTVDGYAERAAPAWTQLLARAVLAGVVLGEAPAGVLSETKADWLIRKIGNDRLAAPRSLELLARILARSESAPDWLRQLLVELSARNHAKPSRDARHLQAVLAESWGTDGAPAPEAVETVASADVVAMPTPAPAPAEIPVAAAA